MRWKWLALLALPASALAADGDACDTTGRERNSQIMVRCNLVCDSKTAASTTCADFAIDSPADTYEFEISDDDGCSGAASVDINTFGLSGTDEHDLTTLTRGGTTAVVIHGNAAHPLTFLAFDLTTMTDCAASPDGFEVKLWRFYERKR